MNNASQQANTPEVAVVIPALNEQDTVGEVVGVSLELTADVVVVSDGSEDNTAAVARTAGAKVIHLAENQGKGPALHTALEATNAEIVVMLDADLVGLTKKHLNTLLEPVLEGRLDMSIGIFEGGGFASDWGNQLTPNLSGQRACSRAWLLSVPDLSKERWPEPAITEHLKTTKIRWAYVELPQVAQILKETKRGFWHGVYARTKMYIDLLTYKIRRKKEN